MEAPPPPARSGSAPGPGTLCLSALGLLRSCGSVLTAPTLSACDLVGYYSPWGSPLSSESRADSECHGSNGDLVDLVEREVSAPPTHTAGLLPPAVLFPALRGLVDLRREDGFPVAFPLAPLASLAPSPCPAARRPRSEKKPTPDEQKDQRYLERRRRNNRAAKKSRDARRAREDQIALRAALLEHENAVLRAQLLTLREEAHSLRQLLLHRPGPGEAPVHPLRLH